MTIKEFLELLNSRAHGGWAMAPLNTEEWVTLAGTAEIVFDGPDDYDGHVQVEVADVVSSLSDEKGPKIERDADGFPVRVFEIGYRLLHLNDSEKANRVEWGWVGVQ